MIRAKFQLKETIVTILAEKKYIEYAKEAIRKNRKDLEDFIRKDPFFRITLEPYPCQSNVPEVVKRMCLASEKFSVGPMSAVAGALAELALEAMIKNGAEHAIVDNGGDLALLVKKPVIVGIYTGESKIKNIALQVVPRKGIFGLCTSSGTVGPSISFGKADAATVIGESAALADAAATALGNAVTDSNQETIENAFYIIKHVKGVEGGIVVIEDKLAVWGKVPKCIRREVNPKLITRAV